MMLSEPADERGMLSQAAGEAEVKKEAEVSVREGRQYA